MRELKIHINKIGEDLVQCDNNCASIAKSLYIGGSLDVPNGIISESLTIYSTTQQTSTSTGAIIVAGGIGVSKNIYISYGGFTTDGIEMALAYNLELFNRHA